MQELKSLADTTRAQLHLHQFTYGAWLHNTQAAGGASTELPAEHGRACGVAHLQQLALQPSLLVSGLRSGTHSVVQLWPSDTAQDPCPRLRHQSSNINLSNAVTVCV